MNTLRASLTLVLCTALAQPTVAFAGPPPPPPPGSSAAAAQPDVPPDPNSVSAEERVNWAKKLFKEAKEAHDREDFYNSVVKFEQAYSFAPDKHIFAFNIGQDAWELRDCARVKQYLELFLVKENNNADLRKKAQEVLTKAENNPECVTGGPAAASSGGGNTGSTGNTSQRPVEDSEDPLALRKRDNDGGGSSDDDAPKKRGTSGVFIGGIVLTVLGIGAIGGGIGTLAIAKNRAGAIEDAANPSSQTGFAQGRYNDDVDSDYSSLGTLNVVTPVLIAAGGALLVGGIAMIAVDRVNKKKGKGFYAGQKRLQVAGFGAAPLPGGGAAGSLALHF